jgi:hypothetical protein
MMVASKHMFLYGGDMAQWEREGGGVLQSNKRATDLMVVAEVVCGLNNACVFIRTLYPC